MASLPRKNSEFLEMYRQDIENILLPYGFAYEDRDEYYGTESSPTEKWRVESHLYFKTTIYGTIYIMITSGGRLCKFNIHANFEPAIQEVANIEIKVFGKIALLRYFNTSRIKNGGEGMIFSLLSSTPIMQDSEIYQKTLNDIKSNLDTYMSLTTPRQLFEYYYKRPNFHDSDFRSPLRTRLGYWLILAKLAGDDYYSELADEYVAINQEKIQKEYNADITKLKEFLDTYVVGTLA